MAWEEFERHGFKGMSGDKPVDELALTLNRIVKAYEDRYSRKPFLAELLYALENVLKSRPAKYLADPESLGAGHLGMRGE